MKEGKVKYIGLSECSPKDVRRAAAVHPIAALEMEWSLFSRDAEAELVPTARELGIGFLAYSPLVGQPVRLPHSSSVPALHLWTSWWRSNIVYYLLKGCCKSLKVLLCLSRVTEATDRYTGKHVQTCR